MAIFGNTFFGWLEINAGSTCEQLREHRPKLLASSATLSSCDGTRLADSQTDRLEVEAPRGCDFIVPITLRVISELQKPLVLRQHHTECDGYFIQIQKIIASQRARPSLTLRVMNNPGWPANSLSANSSLPMLPFAVFANPKSEC